LIAVAFLFGLLAEVVKLAMLEALEIESCLHLAPIVSTAPPFFPKKPTMAELVGQFVTPVTVVAA
jgi:hypothetical protein